MGAPLKNKFKVGDLVSIDNSIDIDQLLVAHGITNMIGVVTKTDETQLQWLRYCLLLQTKSGSRLFWFREQELTAVV